MCRKYVQSLLHEEKRFVKTQRRVDDMKWLLKCVNVYSIMTGYLIITIIAFVLHCRIERQSCMLLM